MAKLSSTNIYGNLTVDGAITEGGQLLSSKYAVASHGTHLTLGTGSGNAYRGDYGNAAYNHSKAAHAPSNAQKNSDITKAEIEAKLTGNITSHNHYIITGTTGTSWTTATRDIQTDCQFEFASHITKSATGLFPVDNNANAIISFNRHSGPHASQLGFSSNGKIYYRWGNGTAITDSTAWQQIYTSGNKPTPADIGAAKASHGTHLTLGTGSGNAAAGNHTHSYLPLSGGTMTGKISGGAMTGTWVAAAGGSSFINSTAGAGDFHPMLSAKTTNGGMTLAFYQNGLQVGYLTKANINAGTNTLAKNAMLMDESGNGTWPGTVSAVTFTENGTTLSNKYAAKSHGTHVSYGGNGSATTVSRSDHTHSYAASSHNHGLLHDSHAVELTNTTTDNGWSMINSSYNGYILKSVRTNANAPNWICNNYAAGVAFGGSDTKGVLSCAYNAPSIKIAGGNGSKPVWWVGLTGTSGTTYDLNKIGTASKLTTARTLTIGATGKSFNGSADVSWSLQDIMKGQGLNAGTASNTLYYNNAGKSHVGRISCYNDDNGDFVQVALYNTSSSKVVSSLNMYANHMRFNRYVIFNEYIRPNSNGSIDSGASNYRWRTVYSANGVSTTSDRTLKENIKYVRMGETEIDYNDMYNFVKDDLELATYNYINSEERHINFIAQDLLANEDGTDNKVGQFIINPVPVPAKEDIENGEPYPLLSYNTNIYTSVLAGALKEAINKIEELENRIKELESK